VFGFAPIAAAPLGATGEGGASYDASFEDASSVADIFASQAVFPVAFADATTISEAAQVEASVFNALSLEGVALLDSTSLLVDFVVSVADGASGTDTATAQADFNVLILELLTGTDNVAAAATFQVAALDGATGVDSASATAVFTPAISEQATASEAVVASTTFPAGILESSAGSEIVAARMDFVTFISELATGDMSTTVVASIFNARVDETVVALELLFTTAVFYVTITDNAIALDQFLGRLLWEIIDDTQNANWVSISVSQSTSWGVIDNIQPTNWQAVQTQN